MDNKDNPQPKNNTVVKFENNDIGLDLLNGRDEAFKFFRDLLGGRGSGITSPAEAMMVYGRCKELNLPFMSTIDHMAVIQGKVCADIHIKNALALRAGNTLHWEDVKEYEPQYKYTDGTNEWTSPHKPVKFLEELKKEDPVAARLFYVWDKKSNEDCVAAKKVPFWNATQKHDVAYNYVTEVHFRRIRTLKNGENVELKAVGRFSSLEGHIAQLGYGGRNSDYVGQRDPNSNWGKYEPRMVYVRAWNNGFVKIASDLGMGMPEIGEMAEVAGIDYKVNPETGDASIHREYKDDVTDVDIIEDESQEAGNSTEDSGTNKE